MQWREHFHRFVSHAISYFPRTKPLHFLLVFLPPLFFSPFIHLCYLSHLHKVYHFFCNMAIPNLESLLVLADLFGGLADAALALPENSGRRLVESTGESSTPDKKVGIRRPVDR